MNGAAAAPRAPQVLFLLTPSAALTKASFAHVTTATCKRPLPSMFPWDSRERGYRDGLRSLRKMLGFHPPGSHGCGLTLGWSLELSLQGLT